MYITTCTDIAYKEITIKKKHKQGFNEISEGINT
jgi:hypothetical protein